MDKIVSASKPFGLRTFYKPRDHGIPCQFIQRIGLKYADPKDVSDLLNLLNKWKLLVPRLPIAGKLIFLSLLVFIMMETQRIVPPGNVVQNHLL